MAKVAFMTAAALMAVTACGADRTVAVPATPEATATTMASAPTSRPRAVSSTTTVTMAPTTAAVPTAPPYIAPDPATVAQFMKGVFRERLEREPREDELQRHIDWYMSEDMEGGDTPARWLEQFDQQYAGEMDYLRQRQEAAERQRRTEECRARYPDDSFRASFCG